MDSGLGLVSPPSFWAQSISVAGLSWVMAKVFTSDVLAESKELTQDRFQSGGAVL